MDRGNFEFNTSSLLSLAGDLLHLLLYWLSGSVVIVWYLQSTVSTYGGECLTTCRLYLFIELFFNIYFHSSFIILTTNELVNIIGQHVIHLKRRADYD